VLRVLSDGARDGRLDAALQMVLQRRAANERRAEMTIILPNNYNMIIDYNNIRPYMEGMIKQLIQRAAGFIQRTWRMYRARNQIQIPVHQVTVKKHHHPPTFETNP
jgi:hypothetical protein